MISKTQLSKNFDRGALTYASVANVQSLIAQRLANFVADHPIQSILEIGCGTGLLSRHLYQRFPNASIQMTDLSLPMLTLCRQHFSANHSIQFIVQDGENICLTKSYDLIASSMVFHWFTDVQKSLATLIRQLAPRGQLIFALLGKNTFPEWQKICATYNIAIGMPAFPELRDLQAAYPALALHVETVHESFPTLYDFLSSLKHLGANTAHANYTPLNLSILRRILRHYSSPLTVSYEVIYGSILNNA